MSCGVDPFETSVVIEPVVIAILNIVSAAERQDFKAREANVELDSESVVEFDGGAAINC